jgi:hypothetical protein
VQAGPSPITAEPVSVATSRIASGPDSATSARPSASTSLPSASVSVTSIEVPLRARITSPGRTAAPPGMFSTSGSTPVTATGTPSSGSARSTPSTLAAPAMSSFMPSMDFPRLRSRPPVSKVTPLPTRPTWARARGGR